MGISRKLEGIYQSLIIPAEEGQALEFLTDAKNARRINDLVEEIRGALMEYHVCVKLLILLLCLTFALDLIARRYPQRELSAHCKSHTLGFCLRGLTNG